MISPKQALTELEAIMHLAALTFGMQRNTVEARLQAGLAYAQAALARQAILDANRS